MKYEIGDSIIFSRNCVKNLWKRGFVTIILKIKSNSSSGYENAFIVTEENGNICKFEKTSIHVFSENLFKPSKALLCEKKILKESNANRIAVKRMAYEIVNGIANRDNG